MHKPGYLTLLEHVVDDGLGPKQRDAAWLEMERRRGGQEESDERR